jgi:L-arabinose transport system substrate-binding protein
MRRFLAVLVLLAGPALLGSLPQAFSAPPRVKIGFLVKMPEEHWFQREWQFAEKAAHDLDFDLVKMGVTDGQKVLDALGILAAQGAQGFVICSPDVRLGPAIAAQAKAKNMKFLAVDDQLLGVNQKPMVPYFGISAKEIGRMVGKVALDEMRRRGWEPDNTGVVALSFHELATASERVEGASAVLREAGFPDASLIDAPQKTTDVEGGFNAASVAITKHPQYRHWITVGINDESVMGSVQALEGRGFGADDVIGVGINGMAVAVAEFQKPRESGFFASVLLDAKRHGYDTAALVYRWITEGTPPPDDTRTSGTVMTRTNYRQVLSEHGLTDLLK